MSNGLSNASLESDSSYGDAQSNVSLETTIIRDVDGDNLGRHVRSVSGVTSVSGAPRADKFNPAEVKDILLCFLFIVKYLSEESLISWWHRIHNSVVYDFFSIIG